MKIHECLKLGEGILSKRNIDNSKFDSNYLMMYVLKCDKSKLILEKEKKISFFDMFKYFFYVLIRSTHKPVAYIIGNKDFMGLSYKVNRNTLIPRDDTEIVVREVLKEINKEKYESNLIIDMCTGSGCIAITLGHELKNSKVLGVDISRKALKVANINSRRNNINNVTFVQSNLFRKLNEYKGKVDVIISNPPYIHEEVYKSLERDVRCFEPKLALTPGVDGTVLYFEIIKEAKKYLRKDGILAFEIDCTYSNILEKELICNDFYDIRVVKDLSGLDRTIIARRK